MGRAFPSGEAMSTLGETNGEGGIMEGEEGVSNCYFHFSL